MDQSFWKLVLIVAVGLCAGSLFLPVYRRVGFAVIRHAVGDPNTDSSQLLQILGLALGLVAGIAPLILLSYALDILPLRENAWIGLTACFVGVVLFQAIAWFRTTCAHLVRRTKMDQTLQIEIEERRRESGLH